MKRVLLAILLVLTCAVIALAGDFSDGWAQGWDAGWKQVRGPYSVAPLSPLPPLPPVGQDDYRDGYAAGVLAGAAAAQLPREYGLKPQI
jgi:hypothetical protein